MNRHVTAKELKKELAERLELLIVYFKTEWNGACQILAPVYEDLAKTYHGTVTFVTVNADRNRALALEYGVNEIPSILFFKNGEVIDHVNGLASKITIVSKIENALMHN